MPKKSYGFTHIHQPSSYSTGDMADSIQKRLDALDAIWASSVSELKSIKDSGKFSVKGQQDARAELAVEVRRKIKDWLTAQNPLDDQMNQLKNEMQPKRNRGDDVIGELRQREVKDYLRTLEPLVIEEKYISAARAGDELFLSAVEESPIPFSFAAQGVVERVKFSRLERAYPEQAKKLADLQTGKANVFSALRSVEADLNKNGLNVADDPLRDQAA